MIKYRPSILFIPILLILIFLCSDVSFARTNISQRKVLTDFKRTYKIPKNRKIIRIRYLGRARNFSRREGYRTVYYHARKVQAINLFTDCGLRVSYIWEVWYRRSRRGYHFAQIAIWSHKFLNKPTKRLPGISYTTIKKLIAKKIDDQAGNQTYKAKLLDIKILSKKGKYNFCMPVYIIRSQIKIAAGENHKNIVDLWSCPTISKIQFRNGQWEVFSHNCLFRGKKQSCYYSRMCKKLGTKSKINTISWSNAKKIIKKHLKKEAKYKIITFLKFNLIRQVKVGSSGTKTMFVIHTVTRNLVPKNQGNHSSDYAYTYDCKSYFTLGYQKYGSKKWEIDDYECCSSSKRKCRSGSCRDYRKCRLIKKVSISNRVKKPINTSGNLVNCSQSKYQSRSSARSLTGWSRGYYNYIMRNGPAPRYCEKARKYLGAAYCKDKKNAKVKKMLIDVLRKCNK